MKRVCKLLRGLLFLFSLVYGGSAVAGAAPLSPVRALPFPTPVISGLAYANGSLWLTSAMGPGMTMLIRMDPLTGAPQFSSLGAVDADVLAHDGTNLYAARDRSAQVCGGTNPNFIQVVDPTSGALMSTLPSPVTSQAGGLALLGSRFFAAGVFDVDPCDAAPGLPSVVELNPADGSLLVSFPVDALGSDPRSLTSDGSNLLYGSWSGPTGTAPSTFGWTVSALSPTGAVVGSVVLFEAQASDVAAANLSFDVTDMAWGANELFVLDMATQTIQVFDFPVLSPPPPPVAAVELDIKPGDPENCINLNSRGKLPVAVLSSMDFDATLLLPETITLAEAPVVQRNNGTWMASAQDVNGDDLVDLVLHFHTRSLVLSTSDTEATLVGMTVDGEEIQASDAVKIVKDAGAVASGSRKRNGRGLNSSGFGASQVSFGLAKNWSNPMLGDASIRFTLPSAERATLELVSVTGRRVYRSEVGYLGAGSHQVDLATDGRLAAGTYFVLLRQGSESSRAKLSLLR